MHLGFPLPRKSDIQCYCGSINYDCLKCFFLVEENIICTMFQMKREFQISETGRFGGITRLYGQKALERFRQGVVCVIGLGGVGSWSVEALARSGVGHFVLIDPDDVCLTNMNRQIHAVDQTVGQPKVFAIRERIMAINPSAEVHTHTIFLNAKNVSELITPRLDCVIDAIDSVSAKCEIIARCRDIGLPAISIGGAGGRVDASMIRKGDLGEAWGDQLLRLVRKKLRRDFGFPKGERTRFGMPCIFSHERQRYWWRDGSVCCSPEPGVSTALDCASGFGTACHVTSVFGMFAAGEALSILAARAGTGPE